MPVLRMVSRILNVPSAIESAVFCGIEKDFFTFEIPARL